MQLTVLFNLCLYHYVYNILNNHMGVSESWLHMSSAPGRANLNGPATFSMKHASDTQHGASEHPVLIGVQE